MVSAPGREESIGAFDRDAREEAVQDKSKSSSATTMRVNEAVMVTVELDYGKGVPSIAEALRDIERRCAPRDGKGRTFAILDAYGSVTPEGKLHISMHVSAEKAGSGMLVFKRTGETLWSAKILPMKNSKRAKQFTGKELSILLGIGGDRTYTVDGSMNPATIIGAHLKEPGLPVRDLWKEGEEREVVFIYSACGCPVKVKARRDMTVTIGGRDARTQLHLELKATGGAAVSAATASLTPPRT